MRLSAAPVLVICLLCVSQAATAETAAEADAKYKYPPYGQQTQSSEQSEPDYNYAPAPTSSAPPAAGNTYDRNPAADGPHSDERVYRDDADRRPGADDAFDAKGEEFSPPREAAIQPPPRFGDRPLVSATASAPDRSIPYDLRAHDARRAAIEAWRDKAAERFGPEFSRWRMAAHRHIDCRPERHGDVVCTVSGEPVRGYGRFGRFDRYAPY
ncbi:hypothetical protein [Hyphomicrobium sp.]|jgi:hypothetical protein|uniref:hypothetical protein n=1 Tax=Hyphomicrobium sp. TaxID=82 RepID=UPI002CC56B06|nr:hypothetical protein [Hyphomicrobium sp.]HVZ05188.1 hypothetical protein [Hyphomicrobium sp.]